jgi:hypothetical protein
MLMMLTISAVTIFTFVGIDVMDMFGGVCCDMNP